MANNDVMPATLVDDRAASPLPTLYESPPCSPGSPSISQDTTTYPFSPRLDNSHARSRAPAPYSRSNLSPSTARYGAPPMTRTKSLPSVGFASTFAISPSHSPVRQSSPLRNPLPLRTVTRKPSDETHPLAPASNFMDIESIAEDSELFFAPRNNTMDREAGTTSPSFGQSYSNTFPRGARRRPPSPLYHGPPPATHAHSAVRPTSPAPRSPGLAAVRFNEPYPSHAGLGLPISATSSIPSTPTSLRSRSPSISSLETIPDSPDAEEAAIEAFNIARLQAAADAADAAHTAHALDVPRASANAARDKRKRWSVCGAERRGDFEMETIWED